LWWNLAEKEPTGPSQRVLQRRSAYWYAQAITQPQFPAEKREALEKRIAQLPAPVPGDAIAGVLPISKSPAIDTPEGDLPPIHPPEVLPSTTQSATATPPATAPLPAVATPVGPPPVVPPPPVTAPAPVPAVATSSFDLLQRVDLKLDV